MIETRVDQGIYIAKITSHFSIDDVEDIVEEAVNEDYTGVILDMSEVEILTSTLLGFVTKLYKGLSGMQIYLSLSSLKPDHQHTIEVMKLDQVILIFEDIHQAVQTLTEK